MESIDSEEHHEGCTIMERRGRDTVQELKLGLHMARHFFRGLFKNKKDADAAFEAWILGEGLRK